MHTQPARVVSRDRAVQERIGLAASILLPELVEDTTLLPERQYALLQLREVQSLHFVEHDISPPLDPLSARADGEF